MTYQKAVEKIEQIIHEIEHGKLPVEEVTKKIKRSAELIEFCKKKLRSSKEELDKLLSNIDLDVD